MSVSGILWRLLDHSIPLIPGQWRLPIRYLALMQNKKVEPELTHLFELCRHFRCAVDIGCNHGFYTYKMLRRFEHVYAFEANPQFDFDICHYKKPNLHFYRFGLSDRAVKANLSIPVKAGVLYDGWASIGARDLPFADAYVQIPVELQQLDDQAFTREHVVDLIKIDVEGHELEALLGGLETIRRHKPVLIIENNTEQNAEVEALLAQEDYRRTDFAAFSGKPLPSPNSIFFPR